METASTRILKEVHSIKEPYDRSRGQIKQITDLCDTIYQKTGKEITFDNTKGFNHYVLVIDGEEYDFNLYRDVIAALNILIKFI